MIWYLILRRNVKLHGECTVSLDEHLAWMRQEQQTGKILFSGPSGDRTLGIYIVRADSRSEAELVASADPFTMAGCCAL